MNYSVLSSIDSPTDIKKLNQQQCLVLCDEMRQEILATVSRNGGHLASNLGVIELTVALHRQFCSPRDGIVFDVSHQAYAHKLLTGRFSKFSSLRKENGLSGFTNPCESEHDLFQLGHSSTSISAALGIAEAKRMKGDESWTVAVIGDGSLSSGLAFEGMNNAGRSQAKLIVVLNDNTMSISRNVGGIARHLAVIRSRKAYLQFKSGLERILLHIPVVGVSLRDFVYRLKKFIKNSIYHSNLFEDMGFAYLGPIDGHNLELLEQVFEVAKSSDKPVLVHVLTQKGKGYLRAEENPSQYHSVAPFDPSVGVQKNNCRDFSTTFSSELLQLAKKDDRICAITAAMCDGTALNHFQAAFPNRFFDVGIAEEHAVTFAGGLSKAGLIPVFAVYSSFLQRSYDELLHDVALQKLPVVLAIDRAGLVGNDGATHHGVFDVSFLTTMPGCAIYSPACYQDIQFALQHAVQKESTVTAIRYPKGCQDDIFDRESILIQDEPFTVYCAQRACATIICYGRVFAEAWKATKLLEKDGKYVTIIKLNRIFPLDYSAIAESCVGKVYFFEETVANGSISSLLAANTAVDITRVTLPNDFVAHASVDCLLRRYFLDAHSIAKRLKGELVFD